MSAMPDVKFEVEGCTIVNHYGGFVVAARIALGVYGLVALEWRLVHGPQLRRRRFG